MISTTLLLIAILGFVVGIYVDHTLTVQQANALANRKIAKAFRRISYENRYFLAHYPANDKFQSTCRNSSNSDTTYVCETFISRIEYHEFIQLGRIVMKVNKVIRLEDLRFNAAYTPKEDGNMSLKKTSSYAAGVCAIPFGCFFQNCTSLFVLLQKAIDV